MKSQLRAQRFPRVHPQWLGRRASLVGHDAVHGANPALQEEGARDDADRAKRHHGACHHRVEVEAKGQEEAHGERDPEHVIHARPDEVASDRAEYRLGEMYCSAATTSSRSDRMSTISAASTAVDI